MVRRQHIVRNGRRTAATAQPRYSEVRVQMLFHHGERRRSRSFQRPGGWPRQGVQEGAARSAQYKWKMDDNPHRQWRCSGRCIAGGVQGRGSAGTGHGERSAGAGEGVRQTFGFAKSSLLSFRKRAAQRNLLSLNSSALVVFALRWNEGARSLRRCANQQSRRKVVRADKL